MAPTTNTRPNISLCRIRHCEATPALLGDVPSSPGSSESNPTGRTAGLYQKTVGKWRPRFQRPSPRKVMMDRGDETAETRRQGDRETRIWGGPISGRKRA